MAAPTLSIAHMSSLTSLPNASPNLIPFHVDHNGPAPISTYFIVEAAKEDVAKPGSVALVQDVEMDPAAESTNMDARPEVVEPPADNSLARRVKDATTRFVATFRGRTMQGLKVELPSGYAGVITVTGEGAQGKAGALKTNIQQVVKDKARGRKMNRATRTRRRDEDEMNGDEETEVGQNSRILMPTAQFSSFVLWHPDIPVDPGRDEYLRSLTEWIRLADEVGSFFFLPNFALTSFP
ncbi:ribonuclease H2, subunit C [Mycena leptocephala]|nr:ribonuclease H2, subunit C [Mycena leptocephala]